MGHNELCLLSGLRPGGGPSHLLLPDDDIDRVIKEMANEIKAISETTPLDLLSILHESIALAASDDSGDDTWNSQKPPGLTDWSYFDICIAIGYFDESDYGGCKACYHNRKTDAVRAPGGRNVELRRVYSDMEDVCFDHVIMGGVHCEMQSDCTTFRGNPNFFVLEGCYKYLEAWLDRDSLPPRSVAFPDDAEPMSIASELYEIINSRKHPRCKCRYAPPMFNQSSDSEIL